MRFVLRFQTFENILFLDETHFETKQLEISKLSLTPEAM